jgi:hypothetical protein
MTQYEVKWSLRQSPWAAATGVFNTIRQTNVIICAGYHSRDICPQGDLEFDEQNTKGNRYALEMEIGDYAIIFERGNQRTALLVRISSRTYRKVIPEITIYRKWEYQNPMYPNSDVVEVCLTGHQTCDFTHSEIMIAYVRDVEVICELDYNTQYAIIETYNSLRTSIIRNTRPERFITI